MHELVKGVNEEELGRRNIEFYEWQRKEVLGDSVEFPKSAVTVSLACHHFLYVCARLEMVEVKSQSLSY